MPRQKPPQKQQPDDPEAPAKVKVQIDGTSDRVQEAVEAIARQERPGDGSDAPPAEDPIAKLLADPKNMAVVTRILPRVWTGPDGTRRKCATKVEKYPCPITADEIASDVLSRFGGRKYKITIHPNTANGENTILDGFTIEDPQNEAPFFDEEAQPAFMSEKDPTWTEQKDPMQEVEDALDQQARVAAKKMKLETLRSAAEGAERPPTQITLPPLPLPRKDERDERIRALEERIALKGVEDRMGDRMKGLEDMVRSLSTTVQQQHSGKPAQDNTVLVELIRSADVKFAEMMKALTAANRPSAPQQDFDKVLDMLVKMKAAIGGTDDARGARIDALIDAALDRFVAGGNEGPSDEEDTLKFAIKQMTPVLKTYVEKQIDKESRQGREVTVEERKRMYAEAAQQAARDLAADWSRKGIAVKMAPTAQRIGGPPVRKPQALPAPQQRREPTVAPAGKEEPMPPQDADLPGVGKIRIPVPPGAPGYDRRPAVNFVLDSIRSEIVQRIAHDRPDETYVVGDALGCLDRELLDRFAAIESGAELDTFLSEWGDPSKVAEIKKAGEEPLVRSWLKRICITIQDEHRRRGAQ